MSASFVSRKGRPATSPRFDCWLAVSAACVRSVGRGSGLAMGGEPVLGAPGDRQGVG
ncbi:hypothetical protein LJR241_008872 [Paraburkholderia hospita]